MCGHYSDQPYVPAVWTAAESVEEDRSGISFRPHGDSATIDPLRLSCLTKASPVLNCVSGFILMSLVNWSTAGSTILALGA